MKDCSLDRYVWEAEAHVNELLDLKHLEEREALIPELYDQWPALLAMFATPDKAVLVFLGEAPTAQERRLAKLATSEQVLLWVQARYLALQAAKALRLAEDVRAVKERGMGYRQAVRHAAQATLRFQDQPSPEDLALLRLPG